jgi:hypothetical protein
MATQPIRTPTGGAYGQAKALTDAQRAAPLPDWEASVVPLDAPTERPNEHVMDGVNAGPGRNAAEAGIPGGMSGDTADDLLATLRGIYARYPLDGIRQAIIDFSQRPPWTLEDLAIDLGPGTQDVALPPPSLPTVDPLGAYAGQVRPGEASVMREVATEMREADLTATNTGPPRMSSDFEGPDDTPEDVARIREEMDQARRFDQRKGAR